MVLGRMHHVLFKERIVQYTIGSNKSCPTHYHELADYVAKTQHYLDHSKLKEVLDLAAKRRGKIIHDKGEQLRKKFFLANLPKVGNVVPDIGYFQAQAEIDIPGLSTFQAEAFMEAIDQHHLIQQLKTMEEELGADVFRLAVRCRFPLFFFLPLMVLVVTRMITERTRMRCCGHRCANWLASASLGHRCRSKTSSPSCPRARKKRTRAKRKSKRRLRLWFRRCPSSWRHSTSPPLPLSSFLLDLLLQSICVFRLLRLLFLCLPRLLLLGSKSLSIPLATNLSLSLYLYSIPPKRFFLNSRRRRRNGSGKRKRMGLLYARRNKEERIQDGSSNGKFPKNHGSSVGQGGFRCSSVAI